MQVRIPITVPETPAWACTFGVDERGIFAGLSIKCIVQLFRWIEPGHYVLGSPKTELGQWDDEGPQHEVTVSVGFWLGETPVTQAFYEAVTGENPSHFKEDPNYPVEQISWDDATAFCEQLNKRLIEFGAVRARLPSEAEWEYACRAGTTSALYNDQELTSTEGTCPHLDALGWYNRNTGGTTHPVAQKLPNQWGLYDMLGNVWEWCEDTWHGDYKGAPTDGRAWVDKQGGIRVCRGGCFRSVARSCRSASRLGWPPGLRDRGVGFRLLLSPRSREASRPVS